MVFSSFLKFHSCSSNHFLFSRKQILELESEKRYLDKSNKHLENILEAIKAHTKQEVSQLNKIHAETIKVHCLYGSYLSSEGTF